MEILFGLHPVEEALRSRTRSFECVYLAREGGGRRLRSLAEDLRNAGVQVRFEDRAVLTRMAGRDEHQGAVAVVRQRRQLELEDLIAAFPSGPLAPRPMVLALDGIEDPQNFGALLRTAEAAGVHGVVIPERRSAPLSPVAIKASAGAAEHLHVVRVVNLVRALERFKQAGLWCAGLDERGSQGYDEFDFTGGCVLVLGREGAGLHDLVKRSCDFLLRIPMAGRVSSLNVSAAGAVVLFEAARQRRPKPGAGREARSSNAVPKGLGS